MPGNNAENLLLVKPNEFSESCLFDFWGSSTSAVWFTELHQHLRAIPDVQSFILDPQGLLLTPLERVDESTGTIDEKIYQRQLNKGEMADDMQQGPGHSGAVQRKASRFTREELRALFSLNSDTACDTADLLRSTSSGAEWQVRRTEPDG